MYMKNMENTTYSHSVMNEQLFKEIFFEALLESDSYDAAIDENDSLQDAILQNVQEK